MTGSAFSPNRVVFTRSSEGLYFSHIAASNLQHDTIMQECQCLADMTQIYIANRHLSCCLSYEQHLTAAGFLSCFPLKCECNLIIALIIVLCYMHCCSVERQYAYQLKTLPLKPCSSSTAGTPGYDGPQSL